MPPKVKKIGVGVTVELTSTECFSHMMSDRQYSCGDEDVAVMRPVFWSSLCIYRESEVKPLFITSKKALKKRVETNIVMVYLCPRC